MHDYYDYYKFAPYTQSNNITDSSKTHRFGIGWTFVESLGFLEFLELLVTQPLLSFCKMSVRDVLGPNAWRILAPRAYHGMALPSECSSAA